MDLSQLSDEELMAQIQVLEAPQAQVAEGNPLAQMSDLELMQKISQAEAQATPYSGPTLFSDPIGALTSRDWWITNNRGEKNKTAEALIKDPIGSLTSKDWWLTRPTGQQITPKQAIVGPATSALDALTFVGAGDELVARGAAGIDNLFGGPGYDARLKEVRDIQKNTPLAGQVLPGIASALKQGIRSLFMSKSPGVINRGLNILKGGAQAAPLGFAYGFGEGEEGLDNRIQSGLDTAKWATWFGAGGRALGEGADVLGNKLRATQKASQGTVLGVDKLSKAKNAKVPVDKEGLRVSANKAVSELPLSDIHQKTLVESGLYNKIASSKTPWLALKKTLDEVGSYIGSLIKEADDALKGLGFDDLSKAGFEPNFKAAKEFASKVSKANASQGKALTREIEKIEANWNKSGKTLSDLKEFQESTGLAKAAFSGSTDPSVNSKLKRIMYGTFAEPLQDAFNTVMAQVNPSKVGALSQANKQYQALKFFEKPIEKVKTGLGESLKKNLRLNPFSGLLPQSVGAGLLSSATGSGVPAAVLGTYKAGQVIKDISPAFTAKVAGKGADLFSKVKPDAVPALAPSLFSTPKTPSKASSTPSLFLGPSPAYAEAPRELKEAKDMKPKGDKFDALTQAVIKQESGGKASAVSHKGAQGLMQIMPATAKEIARELGVTKYDIHDPKTNEKFGRHYLKKMLGMFDGDIELALAAYNAGPGKVKEWVKQYGDDWSTISSNLKSKNHYLETVGYVPAIMRNFNKIVKV